jgi:DNA-binding GntR family transcriptional regulator
MMSASAPGTKTDLAYGFIKQRIIRGEYSPGHRLVLDKISREADVSQVPVREALRRLEAEGYVVYEHNSGARVAELDATAYDGIQHVIAVLEGAATAAAAPYVTPASLQKARALNEAMKRRRENFDAEGFIQLNIEFHDVICAHCPNSYLLEQLARERARMTLIRRPTLGIVMRMSDVFLKDHDEILRLIEDDPSSSRIQIVAQTHKLRMIAAVHDDSAAKRVEKEHAVG